MSFTLAAATAALREFVLPVAREQMNNTCDFWKLVTKSSERVEGQEAVVSLHVRRNAGISAGAEGVALPNAGRQGYVKMRVPLRLPLVGRIQLTEQAMVGLAGSSSIIGSPLMSESKSVINDLCRDANRQVFGTGTGVIANCGVTSASTTVVLTGATATQMRQFDVGMLVDIGTVANPTSIATARSINAINLATPSITISGAAVTTAATDRVFRSGNGGALGGTTQREMTGLQAITPLPAGTALTPATAGVLFGVDPVAEPSWVPGNAGSAASTAGGNRPPAEALYQTMLDDTSINSGEEIDLIFVSHGVYRQTASLLTSLKRFNDTNNLSGGVQGLDMTSGGKQTTLLRDRDCPENSAFGINTDHIEIAQWGDGFSWMDRDGAVLNRVPNQAAYEATVLWFGDILVDQRNTHASMDRLNG